MIFLPETRYLSLDAGQKRSGRSVERAAPRAARVMSRVVPVVAALLLTALCLVLAASPAGARPVRRTLNFNMFLLQPNKTTAPDRFLLTTDGVSRFGPLLEYFIQRVQGMMSVRVPEHHQQQLADEQAAGGVPLADTAENEVDASPESRMPGVVVRPSRTKPGTYEVEINVVVDDGQPDYNKHSTSN